MEIEDLYALIPEFLCHPGCTECCRNFGVPSRTQIEDQRIREYLRAQGRELKQAQGTSCPYVSDQGCTIYPVRPLTCRLYGSSPNYSCRVGARPVRFLHEDEEATIFQLYHSHFF